MRPFCPFDLLKADDSHYLILVGGRRGRHPRIGRELLTLENEDLQFEKFREEILQEIAKKTEKQTHQPFRSIFF